MWKINLFQSSNIIRCTHSRIPIRNNRTKPRHGLHKSPSVMQRVKYKMQPKNRILHRRDKICPSRNNGRSRFSERRFRRKRVGKQISRRPPSSRHVHANRRYISNNNHRRSRRRRKSNRRRPNVRRRIK